MPWAGQIHCRRHTRELSEDAQPGHCADENSDLQEQEQLQVALTSHFLARSACHLHADSEAGHHGATDQEHDDIQQKRHDGHNKSEQECVVVQEPINRHAY